MFTYFSCFPYSLSVPDALGCYALGGPLGADDGIIVEDEQVEEDEDACH